MVTIVQLLTLPEILAFQKIRNFEKQVLFLREETHF